MYRCTPWSALLVLILLLPVPAAAQPAFRVDDLNATLTGGTDQWPFSAWFVEMNGIVYFTVADGIHGQELWRTNGTAGGTWLVKDICPGSCPSAPQGLTVAGGQLFFHADDGVHGRELWTSDGTYNGTSMVEEIQPGLASSSVGQPLGALGGLLLFPAGDDSTGSELWVSDGTAAGTHLLVELEPGTEGSSPEPVAGTGTVLFFSATTTAEGRELWVTDGTAAGTGLVEDIRPGSAGAIVAQPPVPWASWAAVSGGRLFFLADDGTHGSELWVSDGTAAGTQLVEDIEPGSDSSSPFRLVAFGGGVLFQARTAGEGNELWTSDGTEAGTQLVKDIYPGTNGSSITEMTAAGPLVFFGAFDGTHGKELWRTDGTEAGTQLVEDIAPGADDGLLVFGLASLTAFGDDVLFFAQDGAHGNELWRSDGTEAGTGLVADIVPGAGSSYFGEAFAPDFKVVANGRWYFRVFGANFWEGIEVWSTDGTTAGTGLLKEINSQTSAFQMTPFGTVWGPFADLNGTLLFHGGDGDSSAELCRSDGTAAGTGLVTELTPGPLPSLVDELTPLGGLALFKGDDNVNGSELWATDGTEAGTSLIADLELSPSGSPDDAPQDLTAFGGHVYFAGPNRELWRSDGTGAEGFRTDVAVSQLFVWENALYFSGADPSIPFSAGELWKSDGTPDGTNLLADLHPSMDSAPSNFTPAGGLLFFSADDCVVGRELWRTDGTTDGTVLVKDVRPGHDPAILRTTYINDLGDSTPMAATSGAGATLFFLADDGVHGEELWKSDGTEDGTVLAHDVVPGARGSEIRWLTAFDDRVFFVADDGVHGRELWMSDGTVTQVLDLVPGPGSSLPSDLSVQGSRLLFSAWDPLHGRELWWSDGTAAGTSLLQDIAPGVKPSSPQRFTRSGSNVYFAATDAVTGFELWALPAAALGEGMAFYTVLPCRVFDTRSGTPLSSDDARSFQIAEACGIPVSARAVAANLTVVGGTGAGHLTVWPAGAPIPGTSTLNFSAGQTRANNAVISLGDGAVDGQAFVAGDGTVHLILDVVGYFQ